MKKSTNISEKLCVYIKKTAAQEEMQVCSSRYSVFVTEFTAPSGMRRGGVGFRAFILTGDGVASLFLRAVEGAVGAFHQCRHVIVGAVPRGDAEAECDAAQCRLKCFAQILTECDHLREIVMEREEDKLIAAVTDEDVTTVDFRVDGIGNLPTARIMPSAAALS